MIVVAVMQPRLKQLEIHFALRVKNIRRDRKPNLYSRNSWNRWLRRCIIELVNKDHTKAKKSNSRGLWQMESTGGHLSFILKTESSLSKTTEVTLFLSRALHNCHRIAQNWQVEESDSNSARTSVMRNCGTQKSIFKHLPQRGAVLFIGKRFSSGVLSLKKRAGNLLSTGNSQMRSNCL